MANYDFDLFVIGAGSGGVRAARVASALGARVAVAEASDLGGTCVNLGCVPKKLFSFAADVHEVVEDAGPYGWDIETKGFDWSKLVANKNAEILRLNGIYARLLDNAGVTTLRGFARFVSPHEIEVEGERYTAERILIATGGRPRPLDVPGSELAVFSDQLFHLKELPKRILLIGGGYIGVEFAGIFHAFGVETHIAHRRSHLLSYFDHDISEIVHQSYVDRGVHVHTPVHVKSLQQGDNGITAHFEEDLSIEVDMVVACIGRIPNTHKLGLEHAGVQTRESGGIDVNERFETNVPHIHALGDILQRVELTPVAINEAMTLVHNLYAGADRTFDYDNIPSAVFSHPPVGTVGLTEKEAQERYGDLDVYVSRFRPMKYTISGRQERSLMKIIVDKKTDRVVGVHVVDPGAPEMIQGFGVALKCGATKAQFDATVGVHPSSAEELVTMRTKRD